jgi:hypothetical protein
MNRKTRAEELRSHRWYGVRDLRSFGHRSRTKQMGYSAEDYSGKPVIGIINTWSDINPCHAHFRRGAHLRNLTVVATGRYSPGTQPRPTKVATSTSSPKDLLSLSPRFTDPQRAVRTPALCGALTTLLSAHDYQGTGRRS